jgi:2-polyprenyl-3-methyl-5-hydroxy-6-metoxy-1,4-benzoquinol methylase
MSTFSRQSEFWNAEARERKGLVGDQLNRPKVVWSMGDLQGQKVLEAGCGNGYVAKHLAARGAEVYGIEQDAKLIEGAVGKPIIRYQQGNVENLPYRDGFFDWVTSVSVLPYVSMESMSHIFENMQRVLKPGGRAIVSVTHPDMYRAESPARSSDPCWIHYTNPRMERMWTQEYFNADGQSSVLDVYDHSFEAYLTSAVRTGLLLTKIWSEIFPERLASVRYGTTFGYPCYLFMEFRK